MHSPIWFSPKHDHVLQNDKVDGQWLSIGLVQTLRSHSLLLPQYPHGTRLIWVSLCSSCVIPMQAQSSDAAWLWSTCSTCLFYLYMMWSSRLGSILILAADPNALYCRYLGRHPGLAEQYYSVLVKSMEDPGVSVRKRAIRLLWECCVRGSAPAAAPAPAAAAVPGGASPFAAHASAVTAQHTFKQALDAMIRIIKR